MAGLKSAGQFLGKRALAVGQNTFRFFIDLGLMLYLTFFLLRDGNKLIQMLIRALPLGDDRERMLFNKFAEITRATIKGNLVVAAIQGALGGLIFWFLGIPAAVLWGVVMAVLSLIPAVGASLIWVPVALYLYAVGEIVDAVILTAFGAIVIGLVDNILRPILVGRDTKLPDYLVLFSTLGGLALFGIVFAVNSSVHSYLILSFSDSEKVALNVGFYYMANAGGRLVGCLFSGLSYQMWGLSGCLLTASAMVLAAGAITIVLAGEQRAPARSEV